jgi:hypothetical protein
VFSVGDPTSNKGGSHVEVYEAHPAPCQTEDLAAFGGEIAGCESHGQRDDHDRRRSHAEKPYSSHLVSSHYVSLGAVGPNR